MKILIFGNDPTGPTGFGKIVNHLARAAGSAGLTPLIVALGRNHDKSFDTARLVSAADREDPKGFQTVEKVLGVEKIQTVVSVGDPWDIAGLAELKTRIDFYWIAVAPVESTPYPRHLLLTKDPHQYLDAALIHAHMDRCVAYSEFGRDAILSMLDGAIHPSSSDVRAPVEVIPLGVDTDGFAPRPKSGSREVYQGQVTDDTLLFTCMKVNSIRSGFDTLLEAWALYLGKARKADPDVADRSRLYLHTVVNQGAYLLPALLHRYDLGRSVLLNPGLEPGECLPLNTIADFHNASDVAVSAARSEGFGLPILEAMSCAVPCVVPNCGGPAEYGGDGAIRVPIAATFHPEFAATDFSIVDKEAFADALLDLALHPEKRAAMGQEARKIALTLTWERFEERWTELLREVAGK